MKHKLLEQLCYLLFISSLFIGCANEMDMIENEINSEINIELMSSVGPEVKELIDYENSTKNKDVLFKVENYLDKLYHDIPQVRLMINWLRARNAKFRISISSTPGSKFESWYTFSPPEISFTSEMNVTLERVLHELLHHLIANSDNIYYPRATPTACEEYEIRVLTDLLMRSTYKNLRIQYQGIFWGSPLYGSYITWLERVIQDVNYNVIDFINGFKMYGVDCINSLRDPRLSSSGLNRYSPRLLWDFWLNYRH